MEPDPRIAERPAPRRRSPVTFVLVSLCLVLSALVLFLAWQNRRLKTLEATASAAKLPPDALKAGDAADPFGILDESGGEAAIAFSDGGPRTLLLVFSSHCPACEKTLPIWNEILEEGPPGDLRLIGIRTDREAPGAGSLFVPGLRFPVHRVKGSPPPFLSRIPFVPAAVLIDGGGRVERVWYGMPTGAQRKELREAIAG